MRPGPGDTARGSDPSGPNPSEIGGDHVPPPNQPAVKAAYQRLWSSPSQNASIWPGPEETTAGSAISVADVPPVALISAEAVPHAPFRNPSVQRWLFVPRQKMLMSPAWSDTVCGVPATLVACGSASGSGNP